MFKLLAMLIMFLFVALALLASRQHRLELTSQSAAIFDTIRDRRQTLLDQRVDIARQTNPWTLVGALKDKGINTGDALRPRSTQFNTPGTTKTPVIETDLIAPLLGDGHSNSARPRN